MSEVYTRELSKLDYNNAFELASSFKGDASIKTACAKLCEKISTKVSELVVKKTNPETKKVEEVLPDSIKVEFTRSELDGFWLALVGTLNSVESDVKSLIIIKNLSKSFGMSNRFNKFEESELVKNKVEDELDLATVDEPLD